MRYTAWELLLFPCLITLVAYSIFCFVIKTIMVQKVKNAHYLAADRLGVLFLVLSLGLFLGTCWFFSPVIDVLSVVETGTREVGGQVIQVEAAPVPFRTFAGGKLCSLTDFTLDNGCVYTILSPAAPEPGDWVRLEYVPDPCFVLACTEVSAQEAAGIVPAPVPTKEERKEAMDRWISPVEQYLIEGAFSVFPVLFLYALWASYRKPRLEKEYAAPGRWEREVLPRRGGLLFWWPLALPPLLALGITLWRGTDHLLLPAVLSIPLLICLLRHMGRRAEFSTSQLILYSPGRRRTYAVTQIRSVNWSTGTQWSPAALELVFLDGRRASFPVLAYTGVGTLRKLLSEHPYLQ